LYRGVFGTQKPGGWLLANAFDLKLKNIANTISSTGAVNFGAVGSCILIASTPHTLETLGKDSSTVFCQMVVAAHPRFDQL